MTAFFPVLVFVAGVLPGLSHAQHAILNEAQNAAGPAGVQSPKEMQTQSQSTTVPQISFSQQVNIVVTVKQDPRVFEMKLAQDDAKIFMDLIVDQKQDRAAAQEIAHHAIMVTKSFSLDDKPADNKEPGTGLYDYRLRISRPDGVILLIAEKLQEEKAIRFENPVPVFQPLTRSP